MTGIHRRVVLFAGPSLSGISAHELPGAFEVRSPVARGDIEELVHSSPQPSIAVIADGMFHQSLSVGHREIREALLSGWTVWGLSSIGAIRAAEMMTLGVKGFGVVYERFVEDPDFSDDEVALLHSPDPPFVPVSEPLVHLRTALEHLCRSGAISEEEKDSIIDRLKRRWYGERTITECCHLLSQHSACPREDISGIRKHFSDFRLKNRDLHCFLRDRAWEEHLT